MATADHSVSNELIEVPPTAYTLDGFTKWTYSQDFPDQGKITFVDGRILIDMSPERYESHNKIKAALNAVIYSLVEGNDLGEYYPDGARFKHEQANISNEPDAMFAAWETLENLRLAPPAKDLVAEGKHIDLYGTPDWVCEVLSDSSVNKDTRVLREAYHKAEIPEYWLIDARGEDIDFQVLVWQPDGYESQEQQAGWTFSPVFDHQFKLTREKNRVGTWRYILDHQPVSD